MSDEHLNRDDDAADPDEYVIDEEGEENLEGVIEDALRAVERGERELADEVAAGAEASGPGAPEIADLEADLDRTQDRLIRALADFDNYRKRTEKERREEQRYAGKQVLMGFLPIVDNLERALESGGKVDDLKTGVQLILRQMQELLRQHGVRKIEAVGRPFDPRLHEALSREEDPGVTEVTVSDELVSGYEMHERLLRPSQVRVAMPPETADGDGSEDGS